MKSLKYILLFAIPLTLAACDGAGSAVSGFGNSVNGNATAVKGMEYTIDENGDIVAKGDPLNPDNNPQNCPVQPPVHPTCSVQSQIDCVCVLP